MGCNNWFLSALQPTALTGFVSGLGCPWAGLRPISHSPSAEQSKAWEGWGYRPPKVPLAPESQCPLSECPPAPVTVAPRLEHQASILKPLSPSRVQGPLQSQQPPGLRRMSPHPTSKVGGKQGRGNWVPSSSSRLGRVLLTVTLQPTHPRVKHLDRAPLLESAPGSDPGALIHSKTISDVTIPLRVISPPTEPRGKC